MYLDRGKCFASFSFYITKNLFEIKKRSTEVLVCSHVFAALRAFQFSCSAVKYSMLRSVGVLSCFPIVFTFRVLIQGIFVRLTQPVWFASQPSLMKSSWYITDMSSLLLAGCYKRLLFYYNGKDSVIVHHFCIPFFLVLLQPVDFIFHL